MDRKNSQLAFLLSLSALPIAGCVINGDDDDDAGDTGSSTQTTTMTTTVSTTDADTTDGTVSTTVSTTDPDTGTEDGETTAADTGPEDSGTTGDVPAVCDMVEAHWMKCQLKDPQAIFDECVTYVNYPGYSADCIQANEDYYACLAAADCAALTGKEPPCTAEQDAIAEACIGGGETTSTGG